VSSTPARGAGAASPAAMAAALQLAQSMETAGEIIRAGLADIRHGLDDAFDEGVQDQLILRSLLTHMVERRGVASTARFAANMLRIQRHLQGEGRAG
jgi:hypothetical protein